MWTAVDEREKPASAAAAALVEVWECFGNGAGNVK